MTASGTVTPKGVVPGTGSAGVESIARERTDRRGGEARRARARRPAAVAPEGADDAEPPPVPPAKGRLDVLA